MSSFMLLFATAIVAVGTQDYPSSPHDLYVSVRTSASPISGRANIAKFTAGEVLPVLHVKDGWLETRVVVDGARQTDWVSVRDVVPSCHPLSRYYVPYEVKGEGLRLSRADAVRVARLHSPEYCARQLAALQAILNPGERDSPAAVLRAWIRYRQEFCIRVIAGGKAVPQRIRQDDPAAGVPQSRSPHVGQAVGGGYLDLLLSQVRIRNSEGNVSGNQDSLYQIEASYEAGQDDRQSVESIRQSLYDSQIRLLEERNGYENTPDNFKVALGIPPELEVQIVDPLLDEFNLIDAQLMEAQAAVNSVLTLIRDEKTHPTLKIQRYDELQPVRRLCGALFAMVENDIQRFEQALPSRIANLQMLALREEVQSGQIDQQIVSVEFLKERLARLQGDIAILKGRIAATLSEIEVIEKTRQAAANDPKVMSGEARMMLRDLFIDLYDELVELSLIEAQARLDTPALMPIELTTETALNIARDNRHDWIAARAAVTEQRTERGEEIGYSRSWRQYCAVDDDIQVRLRRILRSIRVNQINFELRRAAVFVAISRTDLTRIGLSRPIFSGAGRSTSARDVQEALQTLLRAQNNFLANWVHYETLRMNLDLELGTIRLDDHGMWIDPGPVTSDGTSDPERASAD